MLWTFATPSRASTRIDDEADRPVDDELDQIAAAVALSLQQRASPRRRCRPSPRRTRAGRASRSAGCGARATAWPCAAAGSLPRLRRAPRARPPSARTRRAAPAEHPLSLRRRPRRQPLIAEQLAASDDELAKALPARFEVGELVEARAGRREQDDLARRRPLARPRRRRRSRSPHSSHLRVRARQRRGDRAARLRRSGTRARQLRCDRLAQRA